MREPIDNILKLSNADLNNHLCKSRPTFARDREPSRIPIRTLKSLKNKSSEVKTNGGHLQCTVKVRKQNKTTFLFNCCGTIRQSIRKMNYRAGRYLKMFCCNKLKCLETNVANYCRCKLNGNMEKNRGPLIVIDPNKTRAAPHSQGGELVFGQNARQ